MALTPLQISAAIEAAALALIANVVYLRATDQEANISADNIDLADKVFCLYNNQPTVNGSLNQESGLVVETIPVEISLLCLADYDDTDQQTDAILDNLYGYAQKMFDRLSLIEVQSTYADNYDISLGDGTTKIYDKTMSGVKLSFNLITQRGVSC